MLRKTRSYLSTAIIIIIIELDQREPNPESFPGRAVLPHFFVWRHVGGVVWKYRIQQKFGLYLWDYDVRVRGDLGEACRNLHLIRSQLCDTPVTSPTGWLALLGHGGG